MPWAKRIGFLFAAVLAVLTAQVAAAAIVVASSGPSASQFPAGKRLDDNGRITLRAGDNVTVLDRRGTKVLKGPGRFAISQPGASMVNSAFAVLTRNMNSTRERIAATRDRTGKPVSPNLWLVDLTRGGTKCIADPSAIGFWRPDDSKVERFRISAAGTLPATLSFAPRVQIASWVPKDGPIRDGSTYTVSHERGNFIGQLTFVVLPTPSRDPQELMALLIGSGCSAQVELLSDAMAIARF